MSASVLPPRKIRFHIIKCPEGFRATCPAFMGWSAWGASEEEARDKLERVMLDILTSTNPPPKFK